MVLAVQLVAAGYEYGWGEQVLLSLKGISWADDTAYVNDWFNDSAPQPHILFDAVTALAESWGIRPQVYFGYWLTSVVVTAAAVVTLTSAWFPRRAWPFETVIGALLVTGPYFALGTFLVIHREAVPNGLGGALGFLTAVLLVVRRDRAAVVAAALTTVVHVQHGSVVAVLLLVAWAVDPHRRTRPVVRWFPAVVVAILAVVYLVGLARGLVAGSGDVTAVCETASPGHCDPDSWPSAVVRDGTSVVLLGVAAAFGARGGPRLRSVALLAVPAAIALGALVTDLVDIEPFESLGRQLFLYRFVMVVAPFAPVAIMLALTRALTSWRRWWDPVIVLAGIAAFVHWHTMTYANLWRFRPVVGGVARAALLIAVAIAVGAVLWRVLWPRLVRGHGGRAGPAGLRTAGRLRAVERLVPAGLAVASVVALLVFGGRATGLVPLRIDYPAGEGAVALGRSIEEATAPGSIVAARPDIGWLRLLSRRAVVVDCKGVPYGGEPWREYNERLEALGVPEPLGCSNAGFAALTAQDVLGLRDRFGATHVLLEPGDRAFAEVLGRWPRLTGEGDQASLFEIPAP